MDGGFSQNRGKQSTGTTLNTDAKFALHTCRENKDQSPDGRLISRGKMLAASGGLVYSINQLISLLISQYRTVANEE